MAQHRYYLVIVMLCRFHVPNASVHMPDSLLKYCVERNDAVMMRGRVCMRAGSVESLLFVLPFHNQSSGSIFCVRISAFDSLFNLCVCCHSFVVSAA